jgi:hypothetical protein
MNRYWDFTEKQRSEMTGDQVRAFLDVELMEKGVAKIATPELQPVQEVALPKASYYEIQRKGEYSTTGTGILFDTADKAAAFIALSPLWEESKYEFGSDKKYVQPGREMGMAVVSLPTEADVSNCAVVLKQNRSVEEANRKANSEYGTAITAVEEATKGVWDDWHDCREKATRCAKVKATREEYLKLCDGNVTTADAFLAKVFSVEAIAKADDWFGDEA